ncbi:LytR/AlgR family response regulator transcription factor [Holdemania massiliensis]|uniref:LytR/AlgR family response regulator transcription factor n=1 Tax=Holdemania massiliensis TaxID=1468449 RepID=UPI0002E6C4A3|nr:LytTR family DNA-binding domain-containing protein [Holdemania massiliensis]
MNVCLLNFQENPGEFIKIYRETIHRKYRFIKNTEFFQKEQVKVLLGTKPYHDVYIILLDDCTQSILEMIEMIRRINERTYFIFSIKQTDEFMELVRPSIRPSAILTYPLNRELLRKTFEEIHVDQNKRCQKQKNLCVKIEGEIHNIPQAMILYIEARSKKMVIRTFGQEIEFYSTFGQIADKLDEHFLRCHKGYMVNCEEIKQVDSHNSLLILTNNVKIPYSRGYKNNVKMWLEKRKSE